MNNALLDQITNHAQRVFPHEACGLVITGSSENYIVECENRSNNPSNSFLIDPVIYHRYRDKISAIYHSHPNRSEEPSAADIASAERCAVPYLILSYPAGRFYTYTPKGVNIQNYEGREFIYGVSDCLTLVADYYQQELGVSVPNGERKSWGWWQEEINQHAMLNGFLAAGFRVVDNLQKNDVILMRLRSLCPNHVAIYQGNSRILHHPAIDTLSRIEMYGHYWRSNSVCYLRKALFIRF